MINISWLCFMDFLQLESLFEQLLQKWYSYEKAFFFFFPPNFEFIEFWNLDSAIISYCMVHSF